MLAHRARSLIVPPMNMFRTTIIVVFLLAILGVLAIGIARMLRGGDPRRANRLIIKKKRKSLDK